MRVAVFDFDGTLCRINSYHVLLRWTLAQKDYFSVRLGTALAARFAGLKSSQALKCLALSRLRSWTRAEVDSLGRQLYVLHLKPKLIEAGLTELRRRRNDGFRVVLVSGAFDFLLRPFCAEHGLDVFAASEVAFNGDQCLGRLAGEEMLGTKKVNFLMQYFAGNKVDWDESWAYSDELADLPMLRLVGNPVMINAPQRPLSGLPATIRFERWE